MSEETRVFIAVEVNQSVKQSLAKVKDLLRDCALEIKWVEDFNFHITLKFLGEISDDKIEEVKKVLEKIAAKRQAFAIEISGLGAFPKLDFPRVIWAGVNQGEEKIMQLQNEIEEKMIELDFTPEKHDYTPHITLGRVKDKGKEELLSDKLKEFPFSFSERDRVSAITLFASELTAQGPKYKVLESFELRD